MFQVKVQIKSNNTTITTLLKIEALSASDTDLMTNAA